MSHIAHFYACLSAFKHCFKSILYSLFYFSKATGGKPVAPQKEESLTSPKVVFALDSKKIGYDASKEQSPASRVEMKSNEVSRDKPPVVPCASPEVKDSPSSVRESITFSKTRRGMLLRPAHIRKPSNSKMDFEKLSVDSSRKADLERLPVEDSVSICHTTSDLNKAPEPNLKTSVLSEETHKDSHRTNSNIISIEEKFEKIPSPSAETTSEQESRKMLSLPFGDAILLYIHIILKLFIYFCLMLIVFSPNLQATNQLKVAKGQILLNL